MLCPACKHPAFETDAACTACGLSLEKADATFGTPPALPPTVADLAGVLSKPDRKAITAAATALHDRFPQVRFTVLTIALAPDVSLPVYTFWIFNRGGICRDVERGAANHDILLTVDPENTRSNITLGYGLEPFVPPDQLTGALAAAAPAFAEKNFADGIQTVVASLTKTLVDVSTSIPQTYGINPHEVRPQPPSGGEF